MKSVLNYVATADLVVATFPKAFERFRCCFSLGLGGGGSDGFTDRLLEEGGSAHYLKNEPGGSPGSSSYQVKYIVGGHGAGVQVGYCGFWFHLKTSSRMVILPEP